jgi:glycosyltransferase involved in cell wall biosynthesis
LLHDARDDRRVQEVILDFFAFPDVEEDASFSGLLAALPEFLGCVVVAIEDAVAFPFLACLIRKKNVSSAKLMPSFPIDWLEPFGLLMIEATACGTPAVAFAGAPCRRSLIRVRRIHRR